MEISRAAQQAEDACSDVEGLRLSAGPTPTPTAISLFAGIGGFDLALERAGARVLMHCERDAFCQSVLRKHWPSVELASDIRTLQASEVPDADIWTAGFPCQDVSLARGNHGRTGLRGEHTSLFFDLIRLASQKRPKVILLENVVGLLNSHRGADFAIVVSELAKIGYAVSWRVLNARYFGAPQSRSRVFISAWRNDYKKSLGSLFEDVIGHVPEPPRRGFLRHSVHGATGAIVPEVAYCVAATSGRHTGNDWSRSYVSYESRVRRPTPTESERLQGFPADWTLPPAVSTNEAKAYDSERYKAAGNAVAVPVVSWIVERIIDQLTMQHSASRSFVSSVHTIAPDLKSSSQALLDITDIALVAEGLAPHRWLTGGCLWRGKLIEASVSPAPSEAIDSLFVTALDSEKPDERFFITPNAAKGILRRADSVGRSLFTPLRSALEKMTQ